MKFAISYELNGVWHSNIVDAPSAEVARKEIQLDMPRIKVCKNIPVATVDHMKPGKPILPVPEGRWEKYCSHCGTVASGEPEFCPHCFAYMGGENEK